MTRHEHNGNSRLVAQRLVAQLAVTMLAIVAGLIGLILTYKALQDWNFLRTGDPESLAILSIIKPSGRGYVPNHEIGLRVVPKQWNNSRFGA